MTGASDPGGSDESDPVPSNGSDPVPSNGSDPVPSRRSVLAACGAGMAALAGCSSVGIGTSDGGEERRYDADRLAEIGRRDLPARPVAFPVAVTDEMIGRHRDRARELLADVPETPSVPNGVVTRRLRDLRDEVVEALEPEANGEDVSGPTTPLDRLDRARGVRADAAEFVSAYRAATGNLDPGNIEEGRNDLRSAVTAFEADWEYRGTDPASALVVHEELETLVGIARRNAEASPPVPGTPIAEVFEVGEIVHDLENGRGSLEDANRLRERYLAETPDPRSFRSTFTVAADRLHRPGLVRTERIHEYVEAGPDDLPFERSLDGTPALQLFDDARRELRFNRTNASGAREQREYATAVIAGGRTIASVRAFETVIDAIEAGKYERPETVDRVATEREGAVAALSDAWETSPATLSVELAEPAFDALRSGHWHLDRGGESAHDVDEVFASFAFAKYLAEVVPDVLDTTLRTLENARG